MPSYTSTTTTSTSGKSQPTVTVTTPKGITITPTTTGGTTTTKTTPSQQTTTQTTSSSPAVTLVIQHATTTPFIYQGTTYIPPTVPDILVPQGSISGTPQPSSMLSTAEATAETINRLSAQEQAIKKQPDYLMQTVTGKELTPGERSQKLLEVQRARSLIKSGVLDWRESYIQDIDEPGFKGAVARSKAFVSGAVIGEPGTVGGITFGSGTAYEHRAAQFESLGAVTVPLLITAPFEFKAITGYKVPKITEAYTSVVAEPAGEAAASKTLFVSQAGKKITTGRIQSEMVVFKSNQMEAVIADHTLRIDNAAKAQIKKLSTISVNTEPITGTTLSKTYQVKMPANFVGTSISDIKVKSPLVSESVVKILSEEPARIGTLNFKPGHAFSYEGTARYLGIGAETPPGKSGYIVDVFRRTQPKAFEYIIGASKTPYVVEPNVVSLPDWFSGRVTAKQIIIGKESQFAATARSGFEGFRNDIITASITKQKTYTPSSLVSLSPKEQTFNEMPHPYANVAKYYNKSAVDIWSKMKNPITEKTVQEYKPPAAKVTQQYRQPTIEKFRQGYVPTITPAQIQMPKVEVAELTKPAVITLPASIQAARQEQRQIERQLTRTIIKPLTIPAPRFAMLPPVFAVPFMPLIPFGVSKKKAGILSGFIPLVRRHGVFKPVTKKPLSLAAAMGLGAKVVKETPAATFKLQQVKAAVLDESSYTYSPEQFYQKDNLYIEKSKYRIKEAGEIFGIQRKGVAAQRKKWKMPKIKMWR